MRRVIRKVADLEEGQPKEGLLTLRMAIDLKEWDLSYKENTASSYKIMDIQYIRTTDILKLPPL